MEKYSGKLKIQRVFKCFLDRLQRIYHVTAKNSGQVIMK